MNGTRHTGTSVAVYKDLKEQILHLELPPGSAISEIDTAAAFHVSRTPVRDAFKMLEREGPLRASSVISKCRTVCSSTST